MCDNVSYSLIICSSVMSNTKGVVKTNIRVERKLVKKCKHVKRSRYLLFSPAGCPIVSPCILTALRWTANMCKNPWVGLLVKLGKVISNKILDDISLTRCVLAQLANGLSSSKPFRTVTSQCPCSSLLYVHRWDIFRDIRQGRTRRTIKVRWINLQPNKFLAVKRREGERNLPQ
jgi:hypothetical protein